MECTAERGSWSIEAHQPMLRQMNSEPRTSVLILKALGKGAAVLVLSVAVILVIFAALLLAVMAGVFGP